MVDFIYYSVGDKRAKVTKEAQEEFEKKYPDAKIHLTYNGRNAQVSLNSRDAFLSKYGADNITYSAYDEDKQYSPDLSVNKYFGANPPVDAPEEANVSISTEMPISKRQQRKAEREAEWLENRAANADMANATIESHQSHKEKIDEYLSSVDKEYKEKQSSEPKKSFWQRLTESMAQAGSERRLGASSYTVDLKKQDIEKGQDYVDAKIAKNISNKIDDKVEEYNDPAKNFVYGVGHGLADTVFDIDTWDSTVGAEEAARVYAITKKLDRGETLTDGEQMIIDALVDDLASDMYMASGFGRGYKAGKVTGESLPFMLETALNPASGFGKQFTKKFGKEVFKQVSKRLGKAAGKAAVYTTRVGADIAGAAMMSATTSQARVAEDALNRLSGDVDFKLNDEGTLDFNGFVGGEDSAFKAYAKAFGANTIEHFSEMVGNYFAPIGQMAKSGTAQLANKIGLKKVSELLTEMTPNGFGSLINDFTERTQWQGVIGEFSEEMVSGALNALIVGDQSLKKYDDNGNINPNYLFEKDNMIDTFLGVAILGGAISAVKTIGYTTPETRYNREISRAKKNLSEYFNEDEISQLEAFASNPMGASYANLTPFFEDSRKKEAKEAAGRYLAAVLNKQGYEIARNADLSGTQQGMNEMRMAAQLGQNMTEADLYDVTEEEAKALRAVEETGLLERLDENDAQYLLRDATSYELFKASNEHWRTDSEREALKNLALVRNAREGLENSLNNRAQALIDASNRISTESATDGVLTVGVHDGHIVFVKGGVRVDNGGIVSPDFVSGYPVEIVNSVTGEASTVDSSEISHAFNVDVDTYNTNNGNTIKAYFQQKWDKFRNTKSVKSKLAEVEQLVGQTVYIDNGNGNNMAEVEIMQILPNGEVVIKGKKGDLGGQSTLRVDIDSFYDSMTRDANGNPIFDQSKFRSQTENINNAQSRIYNQEQTTTEVTPQEAEVTEEDDFRDTVAPILINGVPVEVEVVSQDNATNRIVYRYTDENGQERTGTASIGEFKTALQQAQEYKPEEPIAPEVPTEPTVEATTEPTPAPTDVPTEIEPVAEEINWDALFEQDQEAFFAELQKQFGEETLDILNEFVSAAQEELDSLNKKKRSSNPNDILATRNQKAALQKRIDAYNQMIAKLTPAPETPVVEEPTSETPVEVTPTEEPTVESAPTEPVEETPVTEAPTDGKSENGFEFNKHNVCTNPEIISVPSVKKGWAVMNEVRLAEFNGKWGSAIDAHTGTGGVGIPLTKSDCKFDTKEEAIADAYKALVSYRASRNGDTGLKDLDNLIKHLEKEYPFVKEAATPAPAPQPAPAEPITTENGFVIVDKEITNPEVIEMPNTPEGDANRIFIGEYNGKWTYGAEALMDNGSWGMTPKMRIENARYDTREEAIKAAISFLENQWRNKHKDAGSTALDSFVQYVKENYLLKASETNGDSVSLNTEPTVESNGEQGSEVNDGSERHSSTHGSKLSYDRGTEDDSEKIERVRGSEVNQGERIEDKYPPRKGNASRQLLMDTFKFTSVSPGVSQKNLNDIYDFLMEMSKLLGISPTSIGQGQTLGLGVLGESVTDKYATYEYKYYRGGIISSPYMRFKNSLLSSVAHEWWHSLDQALSYYETGKGIMPASKAASSEFSGRPEVLSAVKDIIDAIKNSGHIERLDKELADNSTALSKSKLDTELAARFFEGYIKAKFAELGINVNGFVPAKINNPTEEEVKKVIPAFDKLFNILKEKEGRKEGSTILYHIREMMEQNNEVKNQLGALVADWIQQGGNFVVMDNEAMLNALEESGNARMLETPDGVIYGFVKDGVVYLNPSLLNANTSIHEYTHLWDNALMQLNRPLWEKGKALMKKTALWKEVVNDPNYADIKDNEDLVASEVHSRLVGTEGAKRLEQLEQEAREKGLTKGAKDLSILGRLREWLNEAAKWLKDTFSVWSKEEIDAVSLDDFLNMPLRDLANFTALPQTESGQITNENGDLVANNNGNGHIQFSISTWREGGRDYLANWLANDKTLAEDEKADILARMDEFYENAQKYTDVYVPFGTWSEAAVKYDKDGNPLMSVIKANGDYSMNLDFSLVCKKRRPLNMLLRELINRNAFASYTLRERELAEINWILQEHGFEVACALCFVDAKRFRVTGVADVFATLYNRFVKALAPDGAQIAHFNYSNNPNVDAVENGIDTMSDEQLNWKKFDAIAKKYGPKTVEGKVAKFLRENPSQRRLVDATDFIDANGFEAVKEGNPTLLSLYNSKKGTGGPKASFGDVQYLNDILKKEKSFDVEKAYAVGGVRLQSFSDFVPHMYFDYMQLFAELAAKKLPAHAYTKEVLFAKIFGMTGIKINMSLVPSVVEGGVAPGLDANGNYAWADAIKDKDGNVIQQAQSFPFDEAMAIQNAEGYSKNCGVIAVGISDAHILKMLNDPNIPFIIPYHKSSLNAIVARMTNIDQYKDYTNVQNTRKADGTKLAKGTPDFNFNAYLRENPEATPQQAAQAYLDWCKEHNYRPKFSQFASHPNYYKLLQDFNTIDAVTGEYTPQGAVTMTFPTEQNEFGNVESLIQQGLQEDAELEEKMSREISSIADKVIDRLKEIEKEPKLSEKKYAEQMAKLADERMARINERAEAEDDGILSRSGDVTTENKDIRYRRSDIQNAAVDYLAGEPRNRVIENAVNEEAAKLGVTVTYKTRSEMPNGHKNDKGYYNTKTGEIVVCTENNASINDAIQTILHEAVAHKGLRQLMGDRFDEFISRVYDALDAETKAKVDELAAKHYNGNKAVAMEEYMATLAESENFAETSAWDKIKSIFEKIINSILGRNDIKIGDNELRYILRASYANMVNPRNMETIEGWAKDTTMREEYKINEATPEILSRSGIDRIEAMAARDAYDAVTFVNFQDIFNAIGNARGFKATAKAVKEGWLKVWNEIQLEHQDNQQAVITGIDAIQRETGNIPIEDFENYLYAQNQSSSRSKIEIKRFEKEKFKPIINQINAIVTAILKSRGLKVRNKKNRIKVYAEVVQYLIAKSGLERNYKFQSTKTRLMTDAEMKPLLDTAQQVYDNEVNLINADPTLTNAERQLNLRDAKDKYDAEVLKIKQTEVPDLRDYSGLTGLFGFDPKDFRAAEAEAQTYVDSFENEFKTEADELWNRINSATKSTLRHSYESGLLSRAQYEQIRDMFDYYIPLRGFSETTAEDVYDYARFDGNNFQPAVANAKGRTSVAFDPIATIMNMAVSEILQGNKNRVKQALYHYVGNRPNSLLSIRDCWYIKDRSTGNFVEAYPDIANGETWEMFEAKMQALEASKDAVMRKKRLDIGYRFQKPADKNEHYIHVMINGEEQAIIVNGNPRLAEGVNGFKDHTKDLIKLVKKANRAASQLFTNYNYKFGGKNFIRDFIWAEFVASIKEDSSYMLRLAGNWAINNPFTIASLMRKYQNGTLDLSNENERLFKEFIENGGQTGYVFIEDLDKQKRKIEAEMQRISKTGNLKTNPVVKATLLLDIINYVNECIELVARFSTYVTSRNTADTNGRPRSIERSIDDAKGITTNFNRKGAQSGRGIIGGVASVMGAFNFFYNAQVQGVQTVKGLHNTHPKKTKVALALWAGLGFAMPFIISLFKGDDEEEIYWNLSDYERKNNICFPFGKGKITMTIPLSPELREIYAIGVTLSDAYFNKSVDADATGLAVECAHLLAKAFIPANPAEGLSVGLTPAESMIMFGTPDVLDPLADIVVNKDWKGAPLEYQTTYNEGAPHYTKVVGKDNWKERVGEKLYKAGEKNLKSYGDIPLYAFEHLVTSGSGGIGVLVKDVANLVSWVTDGKLPENLNQIPVVRTLFSSSAMDDEKFVNTTYWKMDEIYDQRTQKISKVYHLTPKEAYETQTGIGNENLVKVYEAKVYPFLQEYHNLNKEISKMYSEIQKMPESTIDEQNDKEIKEQELFNKKRELVYKLLKYEID